MFFTIASSIVSNASDRTVLDLYGASIDPRDSRYTPYRRQALEEEGPSEASADPSAAEGRLIWTSGSEPGRESSDEDKKLTGSDIRARIEQTHEGIRAIKSLPSSATSESTKETLRTLAERIITLQKKLANRPHAELLMELMEQEPKGGEPSGKAKEKSKSQKQEKETAASLHDLHESSDAEEASAAASVSVDETVSVAAASDLAVAGDMKSADVSGQGSEDRRKVGTHHEQQRPSQALAQLSQGVIEPRATPGAHPPHPRVMVGPGGAIVGEHQLPGGIRRAEHEASLDGRIADWRNDVASREAGAPSPGQVPTGFTLQQAAPLTGVLAGSVGRGAHGGNFDEPTGSRTKRGRKPSQQINPSLEGLLNNPLDPGKVARDQYVSVERC